MVLNDIDRFINEKIIVPDKVILLVTLSQNQRWRCPNWHFGRPLLFKWFRVKSILPPQLVMKYEPPYPLNSKTIDCTPSNWKPLQGEGIGDVLVGGIQGRIERERGRIQTCGVSMPYYQNYLIDHFELPNGVICLILWFEVMHDAWFNF